MSSSNTDLTAKTYTLSGYIGLLIMLSGCSPFALKNEHKDITSYHELWKEWQINRSDITNEKTLSYSIFPEENHNELKKFITEVLDKNPDLQSIIATAQAAKYSHSHTKGYSLPQIDLEADKSHNGSRGQQTLKNARISIKTSWALDLWGKLSDERQALRLLEEKSQYDVQQAKRALVVQASHQWLQHQKKTKKQQKLEVIQSLYKQNLEHHQNSYVLGLIDTDTYLETKNRFMEHQVRLKYAQLETTATKQVLNILRGKTPNASLNPGEFYFPKYRLTLPNEIDATTLINRPDIRAAFSQAKAFDYSARSAHKAMLPQIGLSGARSQSGTSLKQALNGDVIWQLLGGITQPIFKGGQLLANAKRKSSEAEANWWQYQALVLKAMEEVESALNQDRGLSYQIIQAQEILDNQNESLQIIAKQFSQGNSNFSQFFNIQLSRIESEIKLIDVYFNYLRNRLTLTQALGIPFNDTNTNPINTSVSSTFTGEALQRKYLQDLMFTSNG